MTELYEDHESCLNSTNSLSLEFLLFITISPIMWELNEQVCRFVCLRDGCGGVRSLDCVCCFFLYHWHILDMPFTIISICLVSEDENLLVSESHTLYLSFYETVFCALCRTKPLN